MKRALIPIIVIFAIIMATWPPWRIGAQTTGINVQIPVLTTTAASGNSQSLALDGKYSNCTVYAVNTANGTTVTVYGNTTGSGPVTNPPPSVNTNFGTAGAITVTTSPTASSGNVANLPTGFYFTWSGNSGTLTAQAVCSSAIASGSGSSTTTVTCANPGCTVIQGTTPWVVTTPGPIATLGPLSSPSPLPSPGAPYTIPITSFQYFWNGSAWVPVTSTAPLPVTTPVPPVTSGTLSPVINVAAGPTNLTQVLAASAGTNIYIYYGSTVSLGTNTAAFAQLYYGTTNSTPCDTGCTPIGPGQIQVAGTLGQQQPFISNTQFSNVITGFYPTASGYKLPASQGLFVKSNGTLTNFEVFVDFAQF